MRSVIGLATRVRATLWSAHPLFPFAAMVTVTLAVSGVAVMYLPMDPVGTWRASTTIPWLDGLCRWDAGWFVSIATGGYWFEPGRQSPVAFYPLFPLLIRALAPLVGSYFAAGILITMTSGLGVVLLLNYWMRQRLDAGAARTAIWALLLYPFSLYLYGAVYSDALFVVAALAAFTFLERDHPWMAGVCGAAATATRPVGLAVVVGLMVRAAERRGVFGIPGARRLHLDRLRAADAGVLLAAAGMGLYWAFLGVRFGDPLAWVHAAAAPGWFVEPGLRSWLKVVFFADLWMGRWDLSNAIRLLHAMLCVAALASIPEVWRRFGIGYAVYAGVVLGIPAVSSPDLFGAGRYALAAFPCVAVAGAYLHERPRLARVVLSASLVAQVGITALYATWHPVS
jgi:hypothetical protein